MSKILYVCHKEEKITELHQAKVEEICNSLNADNITSNPTFIYSGQNIIFGINNPVIKLPHHHLNILLGEPFKKGSWEIIGEDYPDGNYALFRTDNDFLEVVCDTLGTRTIWYYQDEKVFISSTSQRAIIQYLGDFQFDERVIPWIISSGSLGPQHSWDKRIKRIPADGSLLLNKRNWRVEIKARTVTFSNSNKSDEEYEELLKETLIDTFRYLDLDFSEWIVSLSGGYDSRSILSLLKISGKNFDQIKTVTWGDKFSLKEKGSDVSIAKKVAKSYQVENKFYDTGDGSVSEEFETIIDRFLKLGEGRNDKIPAYLDGFKTWKILFEAGNKGVIRGDEVFGYNKIYSSLTVRDFMGLTLCSDYTNLSKYKYINNLEQKLPEEYAQQPGESLDTWRDRLFHLYRIPSIQASLADLKYSFIEQIDPFLSKKIVYLVRTMPDHLRTNKALFKKIMSSINPNVPFATGLPSSNKLKQLFYKKSTVEMVKKELQSENAKSIFPEEFLNDLLDFYKSKTEKPSSEKDLMKSLFKKLIPTKFKKRIVQHRNNLNLDENQLRFRIYLICRMNKIINEDIKPSKN